MEKLTYELVLKEFPELKSVELDGSTDFDQVAKVIGSRNPKHVWPVINLLERGAEATTEAKAKLKRLFG